MSVTWAGWAVAAGTGGFAGGWLEVGEGVGLGVGDGEGVGLGVGDGEGVGLGEAVGVGDGEGVGLGDGVGLGEGDCWAWGLEGVEAGGTEDGLERCCW